MRLIKLLATFSQAESFTDLAEQEDDALKEFPEFRPLISRVANAEFAHLARLQVHAVWIEDLAELFGLPSSSIPPYDSSPSIVG